MSSDDGKSLNRWMRLAAVAAGYDVAPRGGGRTELARNADVSVNTINRMLDDPKPVPKLDVLRRVGEALGYSLGDVLVQAGLANPDELGQVTGMPRLDQGERRILDHPGLDEETRYAILARYRRIRDEAVALALRSLEEDKAGTRRA